MNKKIGIGLLGLGTVGSGVAKIISAPSGRHPLVSSLYIAKIAVRNLNRRKEEESIYASMLTQNPIDVIEDPSVQIVVEVMGGLEPARTLILKAIKLGKSVVTANKAVIARHGEEIAKAANDNGVYVLIEAAVGGGIPIIEPLKQSLGANRIKKVSGIINGTTNYILSRMSKEGVSYKEVLEEAQKLGYAESDPTADVEGHDAADKIAILSSLAFGGQVDRSSIPTKGISNLQNKDVKFANKLGYELKLLAVGEQVKSNEAPLKSSLPLSLRVEPTLVPKDNPLAGVDGVNNAIVVEGDPIGKVMFYGPGAGAGPTASAVVADILNIVGVNLMSKKDNSIDPLLSALSWQKCHLAESSEIIQKNYLRLITEDTAGVIGKIGSILGSLDVSIESIVQLDTNDDSAEIVVITHEVRKGQINDSLFKIKQLSEVNQIAAHIGCL